ncbi:hypothetical protein [Hyphomonas sp.]|uniref:hypothetical protein n=1 Tax=Hyphomonas sp. TaxID=87 RepID=UPI0039199F40
MMTDDEIETVARAMMACTLPKAGWTHAAHFAAALWLLRERGETAARAEMPGLIRRYNESVGGRNTETEGYHETITQASLTMAARALAGAGEAPLSDVLAALMAGPCGKPGWILAHWSQEVLFSAEARRAWIAPDLAPLPAG